MENIKLTNPQIKRIEYNILKEFAAFCDEHGIAYYLAYGTLLGAIRHKGFIPWDDDIDVVMLRKDYERFSELMEHRTIASHLEWRSLENGKWYEPFGKLCDIRTVAYKNENKGGLWIDVFPLDYYDENVLKRNIILRAIHVAKTTTHFSLNSKGILKLLLKTLFWGKDLTKLAQTIRKNAVSVGKTDKVVASVWTSSKCGIFDIHLFEKVTNVLFEDSYFKTVANWDDFLRISYGNYMELPPKNQRRSHLLDAYWISDEPLDI